jgi:hypothetical protein
MQYFNHDLVLLPFFFDEIENSHEENHKHVFERNVETGEKEAVCGCG